MLGQIFGSGAGLLLVALAAISTHYLLRGGGGGGAGAFGRGGGGKGVKARAHVWALRFTVILMFLGAILMTVTGLGNLIHTVVMFPLGFLGVSAVVVSTILFAIALLEVIHGLIKKPTKTTVWAAFFLAFTLTLPLAGIFGQMANTLLSSGDTYAASISSTLGF
jgi:uncharacterized membrane protein